MEFNPNIVCFSCKFGWGYVADKTASGNATPENWVPVVCSGKVETTQLLEAFRAGADGVLILGCQEGHCHYQDGNFQTGKKVYLLQKVLESFGIEHERIRMELSRNPEGDKIVQLINEMKQNISKLGPMRRL